MLPVLFLNPLFAEPLTTNILVGMTITLVNDKRKQS